MLQIGAASVLQIGGSVITIWGSYYKLGQPLLQNRAAITNWGKTYHKLGLVLQITAIIRNWGITGVNILRLFGKKTFFVETVYQLMNFDTNLLSCHLSCLLLQTYT